jgi:hypothetical protein
LNDFWYHIDVILCPSASHQKNWKSKIFLLHFSCIFWPSFVLPLVSFANDNAINKEKGAKIGSAMSNNSVASPSLLYLSLNLIKLDPVIWRH